MSTTNGEEKVASSSAIVLESVKQQLDDNNNNNNDRTNHYCLVCYTDFKSSTNHRSKGGGSGSTSNTIPNNIITLVPCDHNEICSICHLRLRYLHNDQRCPICKQVNEQVICDYYSPTNNPRITSSQQVQIQIQQQRPKRFDEYPIWGDSLGPEYIYVNDENHIGMFFPIEYYNTIIEPLFGYYCTIPNCPYSSKNRNLLLENNLSTNEENSNKKLLNNNQQSNDEFAIINPSNTATAGGGTTTSSTSLNPLRLLQEHLRLEHKLALCNLCVENKRDFVARLPRFSVGGLKKHLAVGDGRSFKGHPACQFCLPTRFYDLSALHQHLQKEHYKCHVCELHNNLPNQYYKDYRALEQHFDHQHYLCYNPQCIQARFVVFSNELDLRHHEKMIHGIVTSDSKIKLQFRVRRSNTDSMNNNNINSRSATGENQYNENDFNYGLDGEAFSVPALPTNNGGGGGGPASWTLPMPSTDQSSPGTSDSSLHPLHVQRTEQLRQQAANLRIQQEQAEAFPSLHEANAAATAAAVAAPAAVSNPANRLNIGGWTSSAAAASTISTIYKNRNPNRGAVTEEDFPSLNVVAPAPSAVTKKVTASTVREKPPPGGGGISSGWATAAAAATIQPTQQSQPLPPIPSAYTLNGLTPLSNPRAIKSMSTTTPRTVAKITATNATPSIDSISDFPTLGGPKNKPATATAATKNGTRASGTVRYSAAEELGKQLAAAKNNPTLVDNDFPSLPLDGTKSKARPVVAAFAPKKAPSPAIDSMLDFPAPISSNATITALNSNMPSISIDEMKTIMGPAKYKTLKKYTKELAGGETDPDRYIEITSSLFDLAYAEVSFWKIIPSIVDSTPLPHTSKKAAAEKYFIQILQQQPTARSAYDQAVKELTVSATPEQQAAAKATAAAKLFPNAIQVQQQPPSAAATAKTTKAAAPSASTWNSASSNLSAKVKAPPPVQAIGQQPIGRYVPPPPPVPSRSFTIKSKPPGGNPWAAGGPTAKKPTKK